MNPKRYLEQRIQGWLPKEPNFPVFQSTARHKILTKRGVFWLFVGITVAMLISGAVFFIFFFSPNWWQYMQTAPADAENTMKSFINALNSYDTDAAWSLMSPALQTSYVTIQNFNGTVVSELQQIGWHAQLLSVTRVWGDFTLPGSLVPNSAHIVAQFQVTQNGMPLTSKSYTFDLVKPSEWRINNSFKR
jgi:hypothetical protein